MTYSTAVPDQNASPGLFPAQGVTNFTRLKTIIDADHKFNDTAAVDDGFHERVSLINQPGPGHPTIPAGANALLYSLNVSLATGTSRTEVFTRNTEGFHLIGARACVVFQGRASMGACTLEMAFNVSGVARSVEGIYTVTFSRNMPTAKYATLAMAQSSGTSETRNAQLVGGANLAVAQTVTTTTLQIQNSSGSNRDPITCAVFIFGG